MLNIRKYLAELMGVEKISDDDIRKELDELKLDNAVEQLTKEGHLAADPEVQMLARKAIAGGATPEEIHKLLKAPRPAPAQTTVVTPPSGPGPAADQVEAQIQQRMAETKEPYHVAATAVAAGGSIQTPTGGEA